LPRQSDDPHRPNTLPRPELNPLLNPLLGQNMGRWAKVYFESPPEKRDEAVQQLVRELEHENPRSDDRRHEGRRFEQRPFEDPGVSQPTLQQKTTPANGRGFAAAADQVQGVTCLWCGYVNRPQYKFCCRCGDTLVDLVDPRAQKFEGGGFERNEPASSHIPHRQILPSLQAAPPPVRADRRSRPREAAPAARSFRPYFGAVVLLVALASGYVAWRGSGTALTISHSVRQAPPAVADSRVQRTTPPSVTGTADTNAAASTTDGEQTPAASTPNPAKAVFTAATPATDPAENNAQSPTASRHGSEELAQARDFLDGKNGKERNTFEAAEWLWKAVRKQNVDATVLLSGMYLRGEGVPKNCEQARILLDAAALKGRKDAAEELQNLPAFGCQ
jgi:hypothetical protein